MSALLDDWRRLNKGSSASPVEGLAGRLAEGLADGNGLVARARRPPSAHAVGGPLCDAIDHALAGPLARASATARVLAGQARDARGPALKSIVDALDAADLLLRDVLEFARASESPRLARRRANLRALCERALDALQHRYPGYDLRFDSDSRVEGGWDPEAIASLLGRLVANAVERSAEGGVVRVRLRGLEWRAVLEVWNAGALPASVSPRGVFEPAPPTRPQGGEGERALGLRLYLAARTVQAHLGHIEVESDVSTGTTVRVSLPLSSREPRARLALMEKHRI